MASGSDDAAIRPIVSGIAGKIVLTALQPALKLDSDFTQQAVQLGAQDRQITVLEFDDAKSQVLFGSLDSPQGFQGRIDSADFFAHAALAQAIGNLFRHFPCSPLWKNLDETQALGSGVLDGQVFRGGESAGDENRFLADLESPATQASGLTAMAEFVFVRLDSHPLASSFWYQSFGAQ
jgi:hypothetical protein